MSWFRRRADKDAAHAIRQDAIIEIVANKAAKQEVIAEAKEANAKLNKLLIENGFTLKIFLAAGGKAPHTKGS